MLLSLPRLETKSAAPLLFFDPPLENNTPKNIKNQETDQPRLEHHNDKKSSY